MPASVPIEPFQATVQGVMDLLPHATFPAALNPGQKGVSQAQIAGYVRDLSGRLNLLLVRRGEVAQDRQTVIAAAARDAVHNGAASYAQAARFPDQAGPGTDNYAGVLWARWEAAVAALVAELDEWIADLEDDPAAMAEAGNSPGWAFPAPVFSTDMRF